MARKSRPELLARRDALTASGQSFGSDVARQVHWPRNKVPSTGAAESKSSSYGSAADDRAVLRLRDSRICPSECCRSCPRGPRPRLRESCRVRGLSSGGRLRGAWQHVAARPAGSGRDSTARAVGAESHAGAGGQHFAERIVCMAEIGVGPRDSRRPSSARAGRRETQSPRDPDNCHESPATGAAPAAAAIIQRSRANGRLRWRPRRQDRQASPRMGQYHPPETPAPRRIPHR